MRRNIAVEDLMILVRREDRGPLYCKRSGASPGQGTMEDLTTQDCKDAARAGVQLGLAHWTGHLQEIAMVEPSYKSL